MGFWDGVKKNAQHRRETVALFHQGGLPGAKKDWMVLIGRQDDNLIVQKGGKSDSPVLATIPIANIINVTLQNSNQANIGKAATGALVGGALLGPLGMLGGAAVSGGGKDISMIVMTIKQGPVNMDVFFNGGPYLSK